MTDKPFAAPREEPEKAPKLERLIDEMRRHASDLAVMSDEDNINAQAAAVSIEKFANRLVALSTPSPVSPPCEEDPIRPLWHPLGDGHHTDEPFTGNDLFVGEVLAWHMGDLFLNSHKHAPLEQWRRVARAMRIHGLRIVNQRPSAAPVSEPPSIAEARQLLKQAVELLDVWQVRALDAEAKLAALRPSAAPVSPKPSGRHKLSCRAYGNFQPPYEHCTCGADPTSEETK